MDRSPLPWRIYTLLILYYISTFLILIVYKKENYENEIIINNFFPLHTKITSHPLENFKISLIADDTRSLLVANNSSKSCFWLLVCYNLLTTWLLYITRLHIDSLPIFLPFSFFPQEKLFYFTLIHFEVSSVTILWTLVMKPCAET